MRSWTARSLAVRRLIPVKKGRDPNMMIYIAYTGSAENGGRYRDPPVAQNFFLQTLVQQIYLELKAKTHISSPKVFFATALSAM